LLPGCLSSTWYFYLSIVEKTNNAWHFPILFVKSYSILLKGQMVWQHAKSLASFRSMHENLRLDLQQQILILAKIKIHGSDSDPTEATTACISVQYCYLNAVCNSGLTISSGILSVLVQSFHYKWIQQPPCAVHVYSK